MPFGHNGINFMVLFLGNNALGEHTPGKGHGELIGN